MSEGGRNGRIKEMGYCVSKHVLEVWEITSPIRGKTDVAGAFQCGHSVETHSFVLSEWSLA